MAAAIDELKEPMAHVFRLASGYGRDPAMEHNHTPEVERRIREAALDHTLEESFPASDPPSTLPNPDDDSLLDDASAVPQGSDVRPHHVP
jgi:hypothetical protein